MNAWTVQEKKNYSQLSSDTIMLIKAAAFWSTIIFLDSFAQEKQTATLLLYGLKRGCHYIPLGSAK